MISLLVICPSLFYKTNSGQIYFLSFIFPGKIIRAALGNQQLINEVSINLPQFMSWVLKVFGIFFAQFVFYVRAIRLFNLIESQM